MYHKTYDIPDVSNWRKLHRGALVFGLMDSHIENIPIAIKSKELLTYVRKYTNDHMPDLDFDLYFRD